MAARQGFEPWEPFGSPVFKTGALSQTQPPRHYNQSETDFQSVVLPTSPLNHCRRREGDVTSL